MFTSAACRAARPGGETLRIETRKHIRLENLSRTTLPADIERGLRRTRLIGVEDVQSQLFRFLPTRQAYVTITHPDFLQRNITKLGNVTIGGHRVTAVPCLEPPTVGNLRGIKGRKAFIERRPFPGVTSSGTMSNGKQVCVWGFPPKATVECVKGFLEQHKIEVLEDEPEIYKVYLRQPDEFSLFSRYLIRMPSISDSYHLARRIHRTFFKSETFGSKFQVRACVVR